MSPPPAEGAYADLVTASHFSFLRGASHPGDMVARALALGHAGIGIADRNSVAGVVRAYVALRDANRELAREGLPPVDFKLAVGARLVFADGTPDIVAYPEDRRGWGRLTRLLSTGNLRAVKGDCILHFADLIAHVDGLLLIVLPQSSAVPQQPHPAPTVALPELNDDAPADLAGTLARLAVAAPGRVWLGLDMPRAGDDARRLARHARIAQAAGVPIVATTDALFAAPADRPLQDVLTAIREGVTVAAAGRRLAANAERHLKSEREMRRLFRSQPQAVDEAARLLARIGFSLDQLRYDYPHEPVPEGWDAQGWLEHIAWHAALDRWQDHVPPQAIAMLHEEFALIRKQRYAHYFLTVHDIVRFARAQSPPILCQGRGSAANSIVCFLLGVTSVDPMKYDLLFSRFVSEERDEPPDIDVDFEHERREEVMQYIYARYGRHRAGIAATVIHFRPRSAVREVGKALGFTEDVTNRLVSTVWGSFAGKMEEARFIDAGFDLANPQMARLRGLIDRILNFPRHLSKHVGGFVLT